MNINEYTWLINKPDAVHDKQTEALEKIVQEFPYFQSARALYLKGLYNQNSFKYNYILKITAAHTVDRSILFDFITSDTFTAIEKDLYDKKTGEILDITVKESEVVEPRLEQRENTIENSILTSIKESETLLREEPSQIQIVAEVVTENEAAPQIEIETGKIPPDTSQTLSETSTETPLENEAVRTDDIIKDWPNENSQIGKPLAFSIEEKHSFQEWLQLSRLNPINREESETDDKYAGEDFEKQKKNDLIDRFIEASPKIPQVKHDTPAPPPIIFEPSQADNSYLMTETLARVYLEQKKYHKAIQAYEILILKYPEKSSFFADRILDIKNIQKNNKQ